MTKDEAHKLANKIIKESWHQVRTKVGETNGKPTIHIIDTQVKGSTTIYTVGQWLAHPLNKVNKPEKKRKAKEVSESLLDFQPTIDSLVAAAVSATRGMTTLADAMSTN